MNKADATPWSGPGARWREREPFSWNALLWALIFPQRSHRIVPTVPGTVLIALSLGIGIAAYNSSSNILFLTLSLLLACLVLSGVLSWLNLRCVTWRIHAAPALRAGHDTLVGLEIRNAKTFLPTYGLWFNLRAQLRRGRIEPKAESTISARGEEIKAALAQADAAEVRGRVALATRLEPRGETRLEWVYQPDRRGRVRLELLSVGSLFPFGFLRKDLGMMLGSEVVVWPAPIEYRRHVATIARRQSGAERASRPGSGNDLLAVRRYQAGDSHRLIHWKASARTRQLLVRQFSAETTQAYVAWLGTDAETWTRPEQFEVLVSFAATLCEDLFRSNRLLGVAVDGEEPIPIRGLRDLESFLDALAVIEPGKSVATNRRPGAYPLLTFIPDGPRGVAAMVDGQRLASA